MKKLYFIPCCLFFLLLTSTFNSLAQNPENWKKEQLVEPFALAASINIKKDIPAIFSIGPGSVIPGSVDIGMIKDVKNFEKFRQQVSKLPKDAHIVIYCGCCPFDRCPNVRPAIAFLQNQSFTNYYLLNLPHNIKTDWIDKGYPVTKK